MNKLPNAVKWLIVLVCLVMPIRSATGTIRGMVTAAWPVPEVMTQFTKDWAKNIPTAFKDCGSVFTRLAIA